MKKKKLIISILIIVLLCCAIFGFKLFTKKTTEKENYIVSKKLSNDFEFLSSDYNNPCSAYTNVYNYNLNGTYKLISEYYEKGKFVSKSETNISGKGTYYYRISYDKNNVFIYNVYKKNGETSSSKGGGKLPFKKLGKATSLKWTLLDKKEIKSGKKYFLSSISVCISSSDNDENSCDYTNSVKFYLQKVKTK